MPGAKAVLRALAPFALHGLAREVDAALGLVLHTSLDLRGLVGAALGILDPAAVAGRMGLWTAAGAALWLLLAGLRARAEGCTFRQALADESAWFAVLYLRPVITLLALGSLAIEPRFPYAFTLPVALTQDLAIGQDAAALAAWIALRFPTLRLPAPRAGEVFFLAFLVYALLTPARARFWDSHPGNEPKTLRMAVALGHGLSLNVEEVTTWMEDLPTRPVLAAAGDALGTVARESVRMAEALPRGPKGVGAEAIGATRITRQTIRGKEGGVYHVLAPGTSLVLAPSLRIERARNLARGAKGDMTVTVLWWNVLAAALVAVVFAFTRAATGRSGLAALLALGFALTPPFLFYFFQFYPEMLGALGLAVAFHLLLFVERWTSRTAWMLGLLLAALPWLHQKFLPVWLVLVVTAAIEARKREAARGFYVALLAPQVVSLYLTALYNFAITGSIRPDALYLAWGPGGVTSARMGQGILGLLVDARYGILPYAPVYLLGIAGLCLPGERAARLRHVAPAALVYYLTVASADNWSGAVCNLGRYFMPVAPLLVAGAGVALARVAARRGAVALALIVAAWTGLFSLALWLDPHAANDGAVLLAGSAFADGNVYIPNLFMKAWSEGAPGLWARIVAWVLLTAAAVLWLRRVAEGRGGRSPLATLAAVAALLLAAAFALERWPTLRGGPSFPNAVEVRPGITVFAPPTARREGDAFVMEGGHAELLVRSRPRIEALTAVVGGEGVLRLPARAPLPLRPAGAILELPLVPVARFRDAGGEEETLYRQQLGVEGALIVRFRPE